MNDKKGRLIRIPQLEGKAKEKSKKKVWVKYAIFYNISLNIWSNNNDRVLSKIKDKIEAM